MYLLSGLDASAIESKMRFLTLVTLASDYIGKELTYAQITSALHIPESDVELWVINGKPETHFSEDIMLTIVGHFASNPIEPFSRKAFSIDSDSSCYAVNDSGLPESGVEDTGRQTGSLEDESCWCTGSGGERTKVGTACTIRATCPWRPCEGGSVGIYLVYLTRDFFGCFCNESNL